MSPGAQDRSCRLFDVFLAFTSAVHGDLEARFVDFAGVDMCDDLVCFWFTGKHMAVDNSCFCRKRKGSKMCEEWRTGREVRLLYG